MSMANLSDPVIPLSTDLSEDCIFENEWAWTPVPQSVRLALDGTATLENISPLAATQPIILDCSWLSKDKVDKLIQLRDRATQNIMTLTMCDGTTKDVVFDHESGEPVEVIPHVLRPDYINVPDPTQDWYQVRLRLLNATGM